MKGQIMRAAIANAMGLGPYPAGNSKADVEERKVIDAQIEVEYERVCDAVPEKIKAGVREHEYREKHGVIKMSNAMRWKERVPPKTDTITILSDRWRRLAAVYAEGDDWKDRKYPGASAFTYQSPDGWTIKTSLSCAAGIRDIRGGMVRGHDMFPMIPVPVYEDFDDDLPF